MNLLKKSFFLFSAFLALLFLLIFALELRSPGSKAEKIDFHIPPNQTTRRIIRDLHREGLIKNRLFFEILLTLKGKSKQIQKGTFNLSRGMSANQIIRIITSGRTKSIRITIPEGFNNRQIANRLLERGLLSSTDEFFRQASNPNLLELYDIPGKSVEGYIFPDTYDIPVDYSQEKLIRHFLNNFFKKTKNIQGFPAQPEKRHELVILASIVEREAKLKEEIALIAGVFQNRLMQNYPLESCATIQYLLKKPRERLYYRDLEIKSPYNTYRNRGLPPGPISNPGLGSLRATLYPQKTDYLFFVVRGDGGHIFSKTLREHNRAKKKHDIFLK